MKLIECYQLFGGNYEDALARLRSEELIKKYLVKFLADITFVNLEIAMGNTNFKDAEREAHTLKGLSSNFGFQELFRLSNAIVEAIRADQIETAYALLPATKEEYEAIINAIQKYQEIN